ncbi:MAG: hypothetical protein E1N59_110 [Puniceicoccaceae bacterium 5H]|nr:MAG: hypothetical protein E1N59_110 [Puniceicoccaceae bacterium 5H]
MTSSLTYSDSTGAQHYKAARATLREAQDRSDVSSGLRHLTAAAEVGHAEAQLELGTLYATGKLVEKDYDAARIWLESSAEQNNANAHFNLGVGFSAGWFGTSPDYTKAAEHYAVASESGNASAALNLGMLHYYQQLPNPKPALAFEQFQLAAAGGLRDGHYSLGVCLTEGYGTEASEEAAFQHYSIAAEQGHVSAQFNLGMYYATGSESVEQDLDTAERWLVQAAQAGHPRANALLQELRAD